MQLNLTTAVTVIGWLALGFTVLAIATRWARRTHPGYGRWAIAGLLLLLSLLLLSLRSAPSWINTVCANAGIALASLFYLEGARVFRGLTRRRRLAYAGGTIAIGAVAFFCYIVPNMNARALVMSTFLGIILSLVSITLLQGVPPEQRFGQTFTGGMFALCAATLLSRACYCYFGPRMSDRNALSGLYGAFFVAIVVEMAGFSTGLSLLADERILSHLNVVQERVSLADTEITRHIEAEAKLRESEERFRGVFEEGPFGLALVGRDYRFFKVNNALCQMVGYPQAELIQKTFTDITHADDVRADVVLAERLFRGEIPSYRVQKRYVKKNGEIIWINLTASLIRGRDGEPLYGLAMVEDVTEVRRTHEEALARQKLESVGTLATGIAHDFNNLLGSVLAQAELALGELAAGVTPEAELNAIRDVALRGSEIVRQLMVYAGKESATLGPLDVSRIVKEMIELLQVSVSKHAVLQTDLDNDLPAVHADAAQIRQIVMNLVTNASEAIEDRDGVIRVITRCVKRGWGSGGKSDRLAEGDYVQLEVSDTGHGIALETQAKVFDPFFTTKSAGRGLGLAIVEGTVRSLGGEIRLTSELGAGSTFQILLPCNEWTSKAVPDLMTRNEAARPFPRALVLVVEDEDILRQAVVKMLRTRGLEVLEAANGSAAIDLLCANGSKIDLILLDMTIPGPSNREIVDQYAQLRPGAKVILTSAYSEDIAKATLSVPQIRGFIRKPFRLGDLTKTLGDILSS